MLKLIYYLLKNLLIFRDIIKKNQVINKNIYNEKIKNLFKFQKLKNLKNFAKLKIFVILSNIDINIKTIKILIFKVRIIFT